MHHSGLRQQTHAFRYLKSSTSQAMACIAMTRTAKRMRELTSQLPQVDPREHNDEFARLPEGVKETVRKDWQKQAEQDAMWARNQQTRLKQDLLGGAVIFLLAQLLDQGFFFGFHFMGILLATGVGAAVGFLWHITKANRFTGPLISFVIGILFAIFCGYVSVFDLLSIVVFSAAERITRESERSGW